MEARARARYMRVTPRKARRVVDLIRGMPAEEARAMLSFAPQSASDPIGKVLASAIANAEHTGRTTASSLVVSGAWVDEGPTLRRFRARAQGRPARINKRTSHITIVVSDETPAARKLAAAAGASAPGRGGSARGTAGRGASSRGGSSRRTSSRSASDDTAATGAANTEGTD